MELKSLTYAVNITEPGKISNRTQIANPVTVIMSVMAWSFVLPIPSR